MSTAAESIQLRPMTAEDLDFVLAVAASLPDAPHWPRELWIEVLNSARPSSRLSRTALVAVRTPGVSSEPEHPAILGFVVASLLNPQAELEAIAVVQAEQRRGLGRRLISELTERLSRAGAAELLLEVRASNLPAIGLYRGCGFTQTGARTAYYVDPVEDAVLMTLRIP